MLQGILIGIVIYIGLFAAKKQLKKLENRVHGCICDCRDSVCELAG